MTATAAHSGKIYVNGTSTTLTGETCALLSGTGTNKKFRISAASKRCLNPGVAVVVYDGVSTIPAANYKINYLFGTIQFTGYDPSGAVTLDGAYYPLLELTNCTAHQLTDARQLVDVTPYQGPGQFGHDYKPTIRSASGNVTNLEAPHYDFDPGAGSETFFQWLVNGTPKFLELQAGDSGDAWRGWVLFHEIPMQGSYGDVWKHTYAFVADQNNGKAYVSWSFE